MRSFGVSLAAAFTLSMSTASIAFADGSCPSGTKAIPAGTFKSAKDGKSVDVAAICVDTFEVTVREYDACVKNGKCTPAATGENCNSGKENRGGHPINCVSWKQATAYCEAQGKRLPTIGEYEWTARGAQTASVYPWGGDKPKNQLCWAGNQTNPGTEEFHSQTCPVGQAKGDVTPQGVHDLAGNVEEWSSSASGKAPNDYFLGGGSAWSWGEAKYVSAAHRSHGGVDDHDFVYGFRCVAPAQK